jgi:transcriptional regulator NrdR family protein
MKRQLRVTKADGTSEAYRHTKIIGTINNALSATGRADMSMAEDLAEVVTYYLYHKQERRQVSSNEIFTMVKAVLAATGHEEAAAALAEHALERRLRRSRTEVLAVKVQDFTDLEKLDQSHLPSTRTAWDKARIVQDLAARSGLSRDAARAVAAMVEERVFKMGMTVVPLSLIKQLVLGETAAALRAQKALQTT